MIWIYIIVFVATILFVISTTYLLRDIEHEEDRIVRKRERFWEHYGLVGPIYRNQFFREGPSRRPTSIAALEVIRDDLLSIAREMAIIGVSSSRIYRDKLTSGPRSSKVSVKVLDEVLYRQEERNKQIERALVDIIERLDLFTKR